MTNPFESDDISYMVLRNAELQYSLWPITIEIPAGWEIAKSADTRSACLQFVEDTWVDMRPKSLAQAMDSASRQ